MKNKQAFTLVELLAVLVLFGLVMLLIVPSLSSLRNSNQKRQFEIYEDMMIEYTKTIPGYKNQSYVCLKDLNLDEINSSITCNGYVTVSGNKLTPYLSCVNENSESMYKTNGFSLPNNCN